MNTSTTSNSFSFIPNDLVLIIGDSMGANCPESVRFAHELATSGEFGSVLHINTFQRPKKHTRCIHQTLGTDANISGGIDGLHFVTNTAGELQYIDNLIDRLIAREGLATIVINSWEMSAGNSRQRERLLFQIQHWLCELELTVIIYAQESKAIPRAGYINRGGFGKLAGIADRVILQLEAENEHAESTNTAEVEVRTQASKPVAEASNDANSPRQLRPAVGVRFEHQRGSLRAARSVGVHNDVGEYQGVTDRIEEFAEAA